MRKSHVLVVSYPAQGHIIPLLELSRRLVSQGLKVTFVGTNFSQGKVNGHEKSTVNVALIEDGLCSEERERPGKLSEWVLKEMPKKVEELIDEINNKNENDETMIGIGCVVAEQSLGWAMDIAERKGIKKAAFFPAAVASLVQLLSIPTFIDDGIIDQDGVVLKDHIIKLSPEMPAMDTTSLVWANLSNDHMRKNIFKLIMSSNNLIKKADRLICNSTYDLEPAAFKLSFQQTIIPIGPLLSSNDHHEIGHRHDYYQCLNWLDQQRANSVIYVAFGSFAVLDPTQLRELALGLELSNKPFLWVVRIDGDDLFPEGFLERVSDRGRVVSWVPQQRVLRHDSVACFVSHCGWNSTVEGVSSGLTFLCWPFFGDQFVNKSYLCDVWRVGLGLVRDETSGLFEREEIRAKLERLFGDVEIRERALSLKDKVNEPCGSTNNFKAFVEWIKS